MPTGSRPYSLAVLVWLAPSYLRELCRSLSLFLRRPSYPGVFCSGEFGGPILLLYDNADPFLFCGWFNSLEWTSNRFKAPPKRCLFSIPPPSQDCSFPLAWPGPGALLSRYFEGHYINFD